MKMLFGLAVILCLSTVMFGHAAEDIALSFDSTSTILSISVTHPVKTTNNHYISSIVVDVNGKERIRQSFPSQFNNTEQVAVYKLFDLQKDDKVNVTTQCNIMGKKKATIIYTSE
jgi:desulfoferrodoxin (superoxide reductase-like protein)